MFRSHVMTSSGKLLQHPENEYLTSDIETKHVAMKDDFHIFRFWQVKNSREKNQFFTLQNNST